MFRMVVMPLYLEKLLNLSTIILFQIVEPFNSIKDERMIVVSYALIRPYMLMMQLYLHKLLNLSTVSNVLL